MPTSADLKATVAAILNREQQYFVMNGVDLLKQACNFARKYAERTIDFELSRVPAKLASVSLSSGGSFAGITDLEGTSLDVKRITAAFMPTTNGSGTFPVNFYTRDRWITQKKLRFENLIKRENADQYITEDSEAYVVQNGDQIYVNPSNTDFWGTGVTTVDLYFDVYKWLPDYDTGSEEDFLLEHCLDYMIFRTINVLSFLKRDAEMGVASQQMWKECYESVKRWNGYIVGGGTDDNNLR
jgi:hypothetical protein